MKMNCGIVQGDWRLNHARANRHGSKMCTVCKTCCMYHLHDQEGSDRYTNRTQEACPLNNTASFFKKLNSELIEKHKAPELGSSNNTSAWSQVICVDCKEHRKFNSEVKAVITDRLILLTIQSRVIKCKSISARGNRLHYTQTNG